MTKKRKIKIGFSDFWPGFDENDNFITNILKKRYEVVITNQPEYLFYSCFGMKFITYDCVKIYYTGENLCPDFNLCDYAIGFEYLTLQDRYIRFPQFLLPQYNMDYDEMLHKHEDVNGTVQSKTGFCSMVVSAGVSAKDKTGVDPFRDTLFDRMCEYKTVASGGRYRNNIGQPSGVEDKKVFQEKYKFALCCENCSHIGYTTEKLIQAFAARTIPIYWGDPKASDIFNPKAFIQCMGEEDIENTIKKIMKIDENEDLYRSMLEQPAMITRNDYRTIQWNQLENWIYHIIDQPIQAAFRRTRVAYEELYRVTIEEREHFYRWKQKLKNIQYRLKK